jgi:mannose-6-phosphate isomerase
LIRIERIVASAVVNFRRNVVSKVPHMADLPLLRFTPILREYLWGGRRLAEFGKPIGSGDHYAESWEIVDHGGDQSVVTDGPLRGTTLHQIVTQHGPLLFGRHYPLRQFPLLFKFLDCQKTLSVQVHPNDCQAALLSPPDLGKTEAWVILAAEPGSQVFAGLKPGVDRNALERALADGNCDRCLYEFKPHVGDCVFIEAGTVHALGAGLLVAEIQQASDTTFRLFDWNRVDRDGKPRALHIEESLETIDFRRGPVGPVVPIVTPQPHVEHLVTSDKFVLDRWKMESRAPLAVDNRFHILSLIEGRARVSAHDCRHELRRGDTVLVPACMNVVEIEPQGRAALLDAYLP